jgi:carbonic anhydrase/acetyltransferase-like protein (isoleucine patch superfamily)
LNLCGGYSGHIDPTAEVHHSAIVEIEAKVLGQAKVHADGKVLGEATVRDRAVLMGTAEDSAIVCGDARVHVGAAVRGMAVVGGHAVVGAWATVPGSAVVGGHTVIPSGLGVDERAVLLRPGSLACGSFCNGFDWNAQLVWDRERSKWFNIVRMACGRGCLEGWPAERIEAHARAMDERHVKYWREVFEDTLELARSSIVIPSEPFQGYRPDEGL